MNQQEADELSSFAKRLFIFDDPLTKMKNSWARLYVEAEIPIPESRRSEFYDEITSTNEQYRNSLEESISWFGVRWSK